MKATLLRFMPRPTRTARFNSRIEHLESRIAPAFVASLAVAAATFTGDAGDDTLVISAEGGLLTHNRFAAGDPGFASATDFDSATAGVQTLAANAASAVTINLGTGKDTVVLGGNQHAAQLLASFTVNNTGADGDTIEVNDAAGTTAVNLAVAGASLTGAGFNISLTGDAFAKFTLRAGLAADVISVTGAPAALTVIESGAGNDTVTGTNAILTTLQIDGGAGSDTIIGGGGADEIHGGPGNDVIIPLRGNDFIFGDDGLDTVTWNPGDGSDTTDGGTGTDLLVFNGANIAENITLSASGNHFRLFRDIANITMDNVGVEQLELATLGGADTVNVTDLSATAMRTIRINSAATGGVPDGATDTLNVTGSDFDDHFRVDSTATGVKVSGLGPTVDLTGFEAADQLVVNGALGVDNVFASSAALAKLAITLIGETAGNALETIGFATPASYDAGKSPAAVAAGNLFGKGAVVSNDLVVADAKSNSIFILSNAGDGTFLPDVQMSSGGKAPRGVVLEDFNADGRLDIAVTNSGSANVAVFLNAGDGTFNAPTVFPTTKTPTALRVGEVTGDVHLDLVMASGGNSVSILAGHSDGTFDLPVKVATGGTAPIDLALADFSGDGRTDIAVANGGSGTVALLRANPDFTFAKAVTTRVGSKPSALAVADFDGDGRLDLAVAHSLSRFVSVLLNASPSTVPFSSQIKLARPGNNAPTAITAGDLDGDGRADLVVGNTAAGTVSVLRNLGAATFAPALTIDLDNTPALKISAVALADFNFDGRLDIVTANAATGDVSVLTRVVG
jgi:hypothetical protein